MNIAATPATSRPPLSDSRAVPARASRLAYAGAAPFLIGALLVWLVHDDVRPYAALALTAYAALVASFLGGVHWGLMPPDAALAMLGALLIGCYLVDRRLYPVYGVAHWLTLRFRLSALAAFGCFIGAAGS